MIDRSVPKKPSPLAAAATLLLLVAAAWASFPGGAAADSHCTRECSAPGHDYKECMDRCIRDEQSEDPERGGHAIRDLCRSKHEDEKRCLKEHGYDD